MARTRIRYIGELATTAWQGATFDRNDWVEEHGLADEFVDTLRTNYTFEVEDLEEPAPVETPAPPAAKTKPAKAAAPAAEPDASMPAEPAPDAPAA